MKHLAHGLTAAVKPHSLEGVMFGGGTAHGPCHGIHIFLPFYTDAVTVSNKMAGSHVTLRLDSQGGKTTTQPPVFTATCINLCSLNISMDVLPVDIGVVLAVMPFRSLESRQSSLPAFFNQSSLEP